MTRGEQAGRIWLVARRRGGTRTGRHRSNRYKELSPVDQLRPATICDAPRRRLLLFAKFTRVTLFRRSLNGWSVADRHVKHEKRLCARRFFGSFVLVWHPIAGWVV